MKERVSAWWDRIHLEFTKYNKTKTLYVQCTVIRLPAATCSVHGSLVVNCPTLVIRKNGAHNNARTHTERITQEKRFETTLLCSTLSTKSLYSSDRSITICDRWKTFWLRKLSRMKIRKCSSNSASKPAELNSKWQQFKVVKCKVCMFGKLNLNTICNCTLF